MSRWILALLSVMGLFFSGCFGLSYRVDRSLLDEVPNEEKLLLFDAENAVYIARDEVVALQRAHDDAERALLRAKRYRKVIADRKENAASIDTPQVLALLTEWNDARIQLREVEIDYVEQRAKLATARLWTARARYERAKAKLVRERNPDAASDIDMEDFEKQVKEREADEAKVLKKLQKIEKRVHKLRDTYHALSSRLQVASNGAYGGPWADLVDEGAP